MSEKNTILSGLSLSLCVYSVKISVKDLNYKDLGEQLEPTKNILAINSNFVHKAYDGFESFINRPKKLTPSKKKLLATHDYKERKKIGDGTCFQSCLEFIVLIDEKTYKMRYFPRSGDLQVFGVTDENFVLVRLLLNILLIFLNIVGFQNLNRLV